MYVRFWEDHVIAYLAIPVHLCFRDVEQIVTVFFCGTTVQEHFRVSSLDAGVSKIVRLCGTVRSDADSSMVVWLIASHRPHHHVRPDKLDEQSHSFE